MNAIERTLKITLYRLIALGKVSEAELGECIDIANAMATVEVVQFQAEPIAATERLLAKIQKNGPWEI